MTANEIRCAVIALLAPVLLVSAPGCSSPKGSSDAGWDAGPEVDGQDGGDDVVTGDLDLGRDFALFIPPGTSFCSMFSTPDLILEHQLKGRVWPRAGFVRLYRDQDSFEGDWIESLQLAPDGLQATPQSAGLFQREITGDESDGTYTYRFSQSFTAAGQAYELSMLAAFDVKSGVAQRPVTELDEYVLSAGGDWPAYFQLLGSFEDQQVPLAYMTCLYELFEHGNMLLVVENDDVVELALRLLDCPPDAICSGNAVKGEVVQATFTRGANQRQVDDFFRLGFCHHHHGNFDYGYLVLFDTPLDGVHGLWIPEPETSIQPLEVRYLDDALEVLDVQLVRERTYNKD